MSEAVMGRCIELARAKINLTLGVLGRRPDGYHEILSLVAFADCGDRLELDVARAPGVSVTGPFGGNIEGPNLIALALARLAEVRPPLRLGHISLEKLLPVAAGVGGGSADAAAALRLVRRLNGQAPEPPDWAGLALALGADVPVCLLDRPCIMRGVGERLQPVDRLPLLAAVLVNAMDPVVPGKTAQVFKALGAPALLAGSGPDMAAGRLPPVDAMGGERAAIVELMRRHPNDLEAPAVRVMPAIAGVLAALGATRGLEIARLSGAGPTCFGIYSSVADAQAAAGQLRRQHPGWWVQSAMIGG